MFTCRDCGRHRVARAVLEGQVLTVTCADCNKSQVGSFRISQTLTVEPRIDVDVIEPVPEEEAKYPWLELAPREQYEEMRRELALPPEVEIPEPGPDVPIIFREPEPMPGVPIVEHDPKFYNRNMNRLWAYGWDQLGDLMGDELYTEFAEPMLHQMADTPEYVAQLYTPHGGSWLQNDFVRLVKENIYQDLATRGSVPDVGRGQFGIEPGYERNEERGEYVYNIVFNKRHPDYLGESPLYVAEETPWLVKLLQQVRAWEVENLEPEELKYVWES